MEQRPHLQGASWAAADMHIRRELDQKHTHAINSTAHLHVGFCAACSFPLHPSQRDHSGPQP